jgi:hypothetical protein
MDEVNNNMEMNYTSKGEHVPEAERNNRTIGERVRANYHNLPYKAIPRIMLKYLLMVSTHQLNLFPAKGRVSAYLSPHVIMMGRNLDFEKHCQVPLELMSKQTRRIILPTLRPPEQLMLSICIP